MGAIAGVNARCRILPIPPQAASGRVVKMNLSVYQCGDMCEPECISCSDSLAENPICPGSNINKRNSKGIV